MEWSDADLVQQTLTGKITAYDELVNRYHRPVYQLAYRMLDNREDASDVTQDAFLRAFAALGSYRQHANFLTWLYKITSNVCIDRIRARRGLQPESLEAEREKGFEPAAGMESDPEMLSIRDDLEDAVGRAVQSLPDRYRVVVVMRYLEGVSVNEIAARLAIPSGTVKTLLYRAREMLRSKLRPLLALETK